LSRASAEVALDPYLGGPVPRDVLVGVGDQRQHGVAVVPQLGERLGRTRQPAQLVLPDQYTVHIEEHKWTLGHGLPLLQGALSLRSIGFRRCSPAP
jgi:hypothetical protein